VPGGCQLTVSVGERTRANQEQPRLAKAMHFWVRSNSSKSAQVAGRKGREEKKGGEQKGGCSEGL